MNAATRAIPGRGKNQLAELSSGSLVAGRFRLEHVLGEGGMATVWSAQHLVTKRRVAIKVLKGLSSPELVQRFLREARAANAVQHPNVVQVHDVFELEPGRPAMVMDLLEGESLGSLLERRGVLTVAELAPLFAPLVSALAAIHAAGVVHRDLKPHNVFLASRPDGSVTPMILDFGICKLDLKAGSLQPLLDSLAHSDVCTTAGRMMGTPCYMAPEQVRGVPDVDARADVWALGVMLYECVSGTLPWPPSESLARIVAGITVGPLLRVEQAAPHLPAELVHVINHMLIRDPAARLTDLAQLVTALERQALADAPTLVAVPGSERPALPAPPTPRQLTTIIRPKLERGTDGALRAPRRSRRGVVIGAALALASAATALVLALAASPRATTPDKSSAERAAARAAARPSPLALEPARAALVLNDATEEAAPPSEAATPKARRAPPKARPPKPVWRDYGGRR